MTAIRKTPTAETLQERAADIARELARKDDEAPPLQTRVLDALAQRDLLPFTWWPIAEALRQWPYLDLSGVCAALHNMLDDAHANLEPEAVRGIAFCALGCFDIPLTMRALDRLASMRQPTSMDRLLEATCKAATADLPRAIAVTTEVLAVDPSNFHALRLRRSWQSDLAARRPPWRVPVADGGELVLEPLREGHAPFLARQYRDPSIARKTLLPEIERPAHAKEWIASRYADGVDPYALIHRKHGLLGSCELTSRGEEAFFCFWIGADWQAQGFGAKLAGIACRHAFRCGAKIVLTAAYDINEVSLRTLHRSGFADVAIRALDPDHDRTFLYLTETPMAMSEVKERLVRFADVANTGLQFPPAN